MNLHNLTKRVRKLEERPEAGDCKICAIHSDDLGEPDWSFLSTEESERLDVLHGKVYRDEVCVGCNELKTFHRPELLLDDELCELCDFHDRHDKLRISGSEPL